jgi:hypothetical protein
MRLSLGPWGALLAISAALAPLPTLASSGTVVMLGPMFHYNFAWSHEGVWSLGVEGSYWPESLFPFGVDAGFEYDMRGWTRLYAEAEGSAVFAGGALGPCLEMGAGRIGAGLQGSAWANILVGADMRVRWLWGGNPGGNPELAPGYYFKFPIVNPRRNIF